MFINCYYDTKRSEMNLWEDVNNEKLFTKIPWTPYIFVPTEEHNRDVKTIYGKPAKKKEFKTYQAYHDFLEKHKNPDISENNVKSEIQFLAERYHQIPDDEMYVPKLLVYYLDIEVRADEGFPNWKDPKDIITLISIRNGITKTTVTFGYDNINNSYYLNDNERDYDLDVKKVKYIKCDNEEELLRKFFAFMHKYSPDVLSGYNIYEFDLPYIINRTKVLFGEDKGRELYSKMSPIKRVSVWKRKSGDKINIDIAGMTILDYYDVYQQYGKNLERYTLEYVCQTVLKVGKLPNPYNSLNELADKDWTRYTDYNIIDCERVNDLEEKLGFIKLIQSMSLLCKSPMRNYTSQTQLIEGLMLTYFRRNGLCAPHFKGGEQGTFTAAHVKQPQKGMHEWVVDIDITSSYPSAIITLNMSLETFFCKISRLEEKAVIDYTRKRCFPSFKALREKDGKWELEVFDGEKLEMFNRALERGLFAIAPCGSVFTTNKPGVIAKVEKIVFFKRKEVKGKKKEWGLKAKECEVDERDNCLEKSMKAHSLQWSLKIMMNAMFGTMSVPYSRYYNVYIAEAITSCGRHTIKSGEKIVNHLFNNTTEELMNIIPFSYKSKIKQFVDYIAYIDTDSLFVMLGKWIKNQGYEEEWNKILDDNKIEYIQKISKLMERYVDDRIFNEVQLVDYNSQVHDFPIRFKQEIIAKTALFVKKKKYAYWLLNEEGIPTDEIKVTGLEIVRSDSSEAIRPRLKHVMEMIMKQKSDDEITSQIRKYKKELLKLDPESLAANIGINNIKKYIKNGTPIKGTPWHIKGVASYRLLLKELGIENKYEDIKEGLKAKVVYIKKNPFGVETVTFNEWPKEFDKIIQYDKDTMIEKFFVKKIRFLLDPINKEYILDCDRDAFKAFF